MPAANPDYVLANPRWCNQFRLVSQAISGSRSVLFHRPRRGCNWWMVTMDIDMNNSPTRRQMCSTKPLLDSLVRKQVRLELIHILVRLDCTRSQVRMAYLRDHVLGDVPTFRPFSRFFAGSHFFQGPIGTTLPFVHYNFLDL